MTFSNPVLAIVNEEANIVSYSASEPLEINKRTNSPETFFSYEKLTYSQYREDPVNDPEIHTGCGTLVYSHDLPGVYDNFEASNLVTPDSPWDGVSHLMYSLYARINIGLE